MGALAPAPGPMGELRPWRTLTRRTLLSRPPWMEVGDERVALPDGREIDGFLWVRTRDFAIIVAVTESGELVMVRSYKHGPRAVGLSFPAGYLEAGEAPQDAAQRELLEETGYASDDWQPLGRYVVDGNYGVCAEHVFLARRARRVAEPDAGDLEVIAIELVPLREALSALQRGEVVQLSAAAALSLAALRLMPAR